MRVIGIISLCFFLGLVVISVAGIFFAIAVPTMSRQEAAVVGPMNSEWAPVQDNEVTTTSPFPPSGTAGPPMALEVVPGTGVPTPVPMNYGRVSVPVRPTSAIGMVALFPLCLLGLLVLGGIGLVVKLFRSDGRSPIANTEEIRLMQEIHQGLSGLERRVESLETLLLDRAMARDGEEWKRV